MPTERVGGIGDSRPPSFQWAFHYGFISYIKLYISCLLFLHLLLAFQQHKLLLHEFINSPFVLPHPPNFLLQWRLGEFLNKNKRRKKKGRCEGWLKSKKCIILFLAAVYKYLTSLWFFYSANASVVSRDEPCDTCTESESVLSGARRGMFHSIDKLIIVGCYKLFPHSSSVKSIRA